MAASLKAADPGRRAGAGGVPPPPPFELTTPGSAAPSRPSAAADAAFVEELPARRRRLGLAFVAVGVAAMAMQSHVEWWLPPEVSGLAFVRRTLGWPELGSAGLAWAWAALCAVMLAWLAWMPVRSAPSIGLAPRLALRPWGATSALAGAVGLVLGSAYLAAGGAAQAVAMVLLVGVASLGWQLRAGGGLALLVGTAAAAAGWDAVLSGTPAFAIAVAIFVAMFVWIDSRHIRASDRRLVAALGERDHLIVDLDARTAQLQAVQQARTRLLASISHDLRQPLQAVRLYAEALRARADLAADAQRLVKQQMHAADDAVAMLDQFSEFSAIEDGMLVSHPELVNLREVLERVAGALQPAYPKSRLRLSVHGRPAWAWLDRSQITRLVQNLAGNAVRYSVGVPIEGPARVVLAVRPHSATGAGAGGAATAAGAAAASVASGASGASGAAAAAPQRATAGRARGYVIDIIDNGRGIPRDKLQAVFEPYVQLAQAAEASHAGRGLGLAIVRGLVTQLGLTLAPIRSRLGNGTRFRVQVPAALVREAPAPRTLAGLPAALRLEGWLLALLDDEEAPRLALRAALEGLGATVMEAESLGRLKTVLDAQERFPDALVFDLDLGVGQPDGRAALAELRQAWETQVPAVILTGRVGAKSLILPAGCSLLEKPVTLTELVAALNRLAPRPDIDLLA